MRYLKVGLLLVTVIAGIGGIFWKLGENKKKIDRDALMAQGTKVAIPIKVAQVTKESLKGDFEIEGSFSPFKQMVLMSDVQGKITSTNLENGQFVNEGKVVVTVDNELIQNQLDLLTLNLQKAERDVTRLSNLIGEGGVTQQQLDDAKLGIETIKTQITGLNKQKSYTYIKAPISGSVANEQVEKGGFLSPGMKIADIINIKKLRMDVYLTEEQVSTISVGGKTRIVADLHPDKNLYGNIIFISNVADLSKRYLVQIEIDNSANLLKAGMTGKAFFVSSKIINSLVIPRECVVGSVREAKVYVVQGDKAVLTPLTLGSTFEDKVQVVGGVQEGTQVVRSGQINLQDGTLITIK